MGFDDQVRVLKEQARALGVRPAELLRQMLEERFDLPDPPLPPPSVPGAPLPGGYHAPSERVYVAMHAIGRPARSVDIAREAGIHRGNVDRHLARLRQDGYVRRVGRGLHEVVPAHELELAKEQQQAS